MKMIDETADPSSSEATEAEQIVQDKRARELALRRLERRECSSQGVYRYLVQKGMPTDSALKAVAYLEERGFVSDERFAKLLVREQAARGKGPYYIQQKLREKGIQMDLAQVGSLTQQVTEISELDAAQQLVERKYPKQWKDKQQAIQGLMRRGFSYTVAREACLKLGAYTES